MSVNWQGVSDIELAGGYATDPAKDLTSDTGAANYETATTTTNLDGGGISWARPGDNDSYDANLTTRSSSYSNIN